MKIREPGAIVAVAVVALVGSGCGSSGDPGRSNESAAAPSPSATGAATRTGQPVGAAVMKVTGGAGRVTIHYRVNGGREQTETDVALPWQKQYPVYDQAESSVSADGGDTPLTCTIMMGHDLVAFKVDPRPTCKFSYWG